MDRGKLSVYTCLGGMLVMLLPAAVHAADFRQLFRKSGDSKTVRCESKAQESTSCALPGKGETRMVRQLSRAACVKGRSWWPTADGIRVGNGCRAEFSKGPVKPVYGSEVIRCESIGHRWTLCDVDTRQGVRLVRQLSDTAPCIRNQSWGVRSQGVWVASGCRAEFKIGNLEDATPATVPARITRCDSDNGMRKRCRIETGRGVRLIHTLSSSPCTLGSTWGYDGKGIWVRRGCRGEFQIDVEPVHDNAPLPIPRSAATVRCESEDNRTQRCPVRSAEHVQLKEQLSRKVCEEGKSWRVEKDAIVVKSGCRGLFAVW